MKRKRAEIGGTSEHFLILSISIWRSGQGCPLLRASSDHCFTVGALRARRAPGRSSPSLQARSFPRRGSAAWLILYCARRTSSVQISIPLLGGVAKAALYCAHRTSTVSSCAFCEQEGHLAASLSPLYFHPSPLVPPPNPPKFPPKPPCPVPQYSPF